MSNRTDFDVLAEELREMFHLSPAATDRIETELHNAYVAGEESTVGDPPEPISMACGWTKTPDRIGALVEAVVRRFGAAGQLCPKCRQPFGAHLIHVSDGSVICPGMMVALTGQEEHDAASRVSDVDRLAPENAYTPNLAKPCGCEGGPMEHSPACAPYIPIVAPSFGEASEYRAYAAAKDVLGELCPKCHAPIGQHLISLDGPMRCPDGLDGAA